MNELHPCEGPHNCPDHDQPDLGCRQCPPWVTETACAGCKKKLRRSLDRLIYDYCLLCAWIGAPIRRHGVVDHGTVSTVRLSCGHLVRRELRRGHKSAYCEECTNA